MTTENTQLATRPTASSALASFIGMEPRMMLDTFKAQCFRNAQNVSDAQLAAFVSIANEMKVNPLLPGMLYAYPTGQGGIVPMMGPDGVYKKLSEHPGIDSWDVEVLPTDPAQPPTHAIARIYRKGVERPLTYTAVLSEWKIGANPNWNTRPRHMLSIRALKQCARQIIHGIPFDEDERVISEVINVTPPDAAPERPVAAKGAATVEKPVRAKRPAPAAEVVVTPEEQVATPAPAATVTPALGANQTTEKQPAPAPAVPAAPDAIPGDPITELAEGQRVSVTCKVKALATGMIDNLPSVRASVTGGFVGDVRHIGGASAVAGGDPLPNAPWKAGAEVVLSLVGKKYAGNAAALAGKVLAYVEKAEAKPEEF